MVEDKNNTDSSDQGSSGKKGQSGPAINKAAEKIIDDVKKFDLMSLIGLGIVVVYFLFMFFDVFNLKWWIMLPLAGAGVFLLYRQRTETRGFEKSMCFYGLIALIVFVVGRDINITNRLDTMIEQTAKVNEIQENILKKLPK